MTIENTTVKTLGSGNGVTTEWPIPFAYRDAADIEVYLVTAAGVETKLTSNYSVDTTDDFVKYPTVESELPPLASPNKISIRRATPVTQTKNLSAQGMSTKESLEAAYDKLTMICQELAEGLARCPKYPIHQSPSQQDVEGFLAEIAQSLADAAAVAQDAADAAASALAASGSETAAAGSALAASNSANTASLAANNAQGSASAASDSADDAEAAAGAASGSASTATDAAAAAQGYRDTAESHKNAAAQSASDASGYADDADGSASAAAGYRDTAESHKNAAAQSASDADASADAAAQSAIDAAASMSSSNAVSIQGKAVSTTAPSDGQALIWSVSEDKYVPGAAGGRLVGTFSGTSVTPISAAIIDESHTYNGSSAQLFTGFGDISGLADGKRITIVGTNDDNTLTINYSNTTNGWLINGPAILGRGNSITLEKSAALSRMVEVCRS